jgi:hypothetical protein
MNTGYTETYLDIQLIFQFLPNSDLESGVRGRNGLTRDIASIFFVPKDICGHPIAYFYNDGGQEISPGYYDILVYHSTPWDIPGCTITNMYAYSTS